MDRTEFDRYLDQLLEPSRFKDYCPNGLQVEGSTRISRVVTGVTASLALVQAAISAGADTIVVHHGYFWRGEDPRITGTRRARIAALLAHNINLYGFHLPLDVHAEVGNNTQLGRVLGWPVSRTAGDYGLVAISELATPTTPSAVLQRLSRRLGQKPLAVGHLNRPVRTIGWCTGAAQDSLDTAIAAGADLYISGEISERTTHLAREAGVVYVCAGHHATERFGIQALGERIQQDLGLPVSFIDDPNPV